MNKLSFESINAKAPYKVKFEPETGAYLFTSDSNIDYLVDFTLDNLVKSDKAYQFVIANVNHKKSPRDKHLKDTVIAIIEEFFANNNSIILILYSTDDNKQRARCRLFEHWFKTSSCNDLFIMRTSSVIDEYGIENIASVILRKDNPRCAIYIYHFGFKSTSSNDDKLVQ